MPDSSIESLLQHPGVWRAGQLGERAGQMQKQPGIATGYAPLDVLLPGGGWPAGGLVECLLVSAGSGELRLLVPALKHLSHARQCWIAWINPPFVPYAPALQAAGIDLNRMLLIHPRNHEEMLWAMERACRSDSCSSVLAWLDERKLNPGDTRRLQLAARHGRTFSCLFRPRTAQAQSSMAELRLALHTTAPGELRLDILKRRGGWPLSDIRIPVRETGTACDATPAMVQQQLKLWRAVQERRRKPSAAKDSHAASAAATPTPDFRPAPATIFPVTQVH